MSDPARAKPILGYGDPLGVQADDAVAFEVHFDEADLASGAAPDALVFAANGYAKDVCRVSEDVVQRFLDPAPFGSRPARDAGGAS